MILALGLLLAGNAAADCAYFFYGTGCPHCALAEPAVRQLQENGVSITSFEVYGNASNAELLNEFFSSRGIPAHERGVPALFYSNGYFLGDRAIAEEAGKTLSGNGTRPCPTASNGNGTFHSSAASPSRQMGSAELIFFVAGAAFVDSINPCAIAVLVILLSALLFAGEPRRALKAGLAFIASVYVAYFLFGLGLFSVIQVSGLSIWIYRLVGVLAIAIGLLNIKDFIWYGRGGFVMEVPRSWRPALKNLLKSVTGPKGAFAAGFIVCPFELPCTGGPYLFTIGLLSAQMTWQQATPILLLYNAVFVLPLLAIVAALHFGWTTLEKTEAFKENNLRNLHLIAGLVMLALGIAALLNAA
ncbi:hypothetical protein AUJ65_02720 [Candidatus Micrarchaeota archaeon CG1_02_51_15]|nr:MAG: hypothetical protein AUJ65_02720 [Candidatus Micrarchaeota archaeon CG1_02_51_15]